MSASDPYSLAQAWAVGLGSLIIMAFSTVGTVLLWVGGLPPSSNSSSNSMSAGYSEPAIAVHLDILAAPLAVILGLASLWFHKSVLRDLRFVTYALVLSFATQSSYSALTFRLFIADIAGNYKMLAGYILTFVSLLLVLLIIGCIVPSLTHPQVNYRSKLAIVYYILALSLGAAGCAVLWTNDHAASYSDEQAAREAMYSIVSIPVVVNLVVLFGAPFFQNIRAAYGSLLIVGSSCFWILYGLFNLQGAAAMFRTDFVIGSALCWASGLVSILCSFAVSKQNFMNSADPKKMNALVDTEQGEHRGIVLNILIFVAAGTCIAASVLFYKVEDHQHWPDWKANGLNFINSEFIIALFFGFVGYAFYKENYDRSNYRYLLYGVLIFIPLTSNHAIVNVIQNIRNAYALNQDGDVYPLSQVRFLAIGEIVGYAGLLAIFSALCGDYRGCTNAGGMYILVLLMTLTGSLVLLLTKHSLEFTESSNTVATLFTIEAIQASVVSIGVAVILLYGGSWTLSVEAAHATLFCVGYACYWILPSSFVILHLPAAGYSWQGFAGSLVCFCTSFLVMFCALLGSNEHEREKVRIYAGFVRKFIIL